MLARHHLLWLLALVALVAVGTKWGPALLGSDIPISGVAWTRVSLNTSEYSDEKILVEFTKSSDIRPVVKFLEQRSSGWKAPSPETVPSAMPTHHLLLNSTRGDLQIELVLCETSCVMWWQKDRQNLCRRLSAVESRELLGLFGMKWNQEKFEVVRQ